MCAPISSNTRRGGFPTLRGRRGVARRPCQGGGGGFVELLVVKASYRGVFWLFMFFGFDFVLETRRTTKLLQKILDYY